MFQIITDSTTDLPESYFAEHNIKVVNLKCIVDGVQYGVDKFLSSDEFYALIRGGKMPTTSQVNPDEAYKAIEEILKKGNEILIVAFSSGLSGTYNSFRLAAEEIKADYPEADILVVDTLAASLGEGLLLDYAIKMRDAGKSMRETRDWLEAHKNNLVHMFTVDDLNHLYRGGRVSKTVAIIGTLHTPLPICHAAHQSW